jgi:hypothetical protein
MIRSLSAVAVNRCFAVNVSGHKSPGFYEFRSFGSVPYPFAAEA